MPVTTLSRLQQRSEDLVSDEVNEVISYRPHWMIRRGNIVFLIVLLVMLTLTFFIRYPDVINGTARLVALNAPLTLTARKEGKVAKIFVANGQKVKRGQHLALLESTSDYRDILNLEHWLKSVLRTAQSGSFEPLVQGLPPSLSNLGDLQDSYQAFVHEWLELQQFFGSGYYQQKRNALQKDLHFANLLKANISRQETLTRQERQLGQLEFSVYDSLVKDSVVAPMDLNKYRANLLQKDHVLAQAEGQLIGNDVTAHNKKKELLDLQKQVFDQQQKFYTALLLLKGQLAQWLNQNVVIAGEAGKVFFLLPLHEQENVTLGQELFYLQLANASYYVQLMAGQNGLGKITEGQLVRLKVLSYPSEQYGYLKGRVDAISEFPNRRDSFLVHVSLPTGLKTEYQQELYFRNNMLASAEIITDDRRLFDRLFEPLKKAWNP